MADDNGGRDNVSVILLRVMSKYTAPRRFVDKVFDWLK